MSNSRKIRELIKSIAGKDGSAPAFITAEVVSVGAETCTVNRNGIELTDVQLNAVVTEDPKTKNLIIKPKVGSMVMIADLSGGQFRDLVIMAWSEIDKITINGGELGGLVNVGALTDKLNGFVKSFNDHTHTIPIGGVSVSGSATAQSNAAVISVPAVAELAQASKLLRGDYEDTTIKH